MQSRPWWIWLCFFIFVIAVILIDIFFLNRQKSQKVSLQKALSWVLVWVSCALVFNGLIGWYETPKVALQFLTGYLIELSLSVDNLFVFIMIFQFFSVPNKYQHRVLLYGVLSAIILRFCLILGGVWLVSELHWILYLFGAFLLWTGLKMLFFKENNQNFSDSKMLQWMRCHMRMTNEIKDEKFFVRKNGIGYATPLFLVLIFIEISDIIFALDSIPAIFAVTQDAFIIFTSNIFAILGLRALYFLLSNIAERFHLLRYGIAIMLSFIGIKMLTDLWIHIPILYALAVVILILTTTVILSLHIPRAENHDH